MSRFKNFVGIHTCKEWFDAALIKSGNASQIIRHQFTQDAEGFTQMTEWLQMFQVHLNENTVFCMEHTGLYNTGIVNHLINYNAQLSLRISFKSINGSLHEKSCDEGTVAVTLARFALRYQDTLKLWQPRFTNIEKINLLVAQRNRIINAAEDLVSPVNSLKNLGYQIEAIQLHKNQSAALAVLKKTIFSIEKIITKTVKQDEQVYTKPKLFQSVKTFGAVTVWGVISSSKRLLQLRNIYN